MTCIATNGFTMAADGRALRGELIVTDDRLKLVRLPDGSVAGVSGDATAAQLCREWLEKGADPACIPTLKPGDEPGSPVHMLILRHDGKVEFMDWSFTPVVQQTPAAIGSGSEVAIGAMLADRSPVEAVRLVASRVASVGGTIVEWEPGKDEA